MTFDMIMLQQHGWKLTNAYVSDQEKARLEQTLLNFTDRTSYLAWVQQWRRDLQQAETAQRARKKLLAGPHDQLQESAAHLQSAQAAAAGTLTRMRRLREASKRAAGRQRVARLEALQPR